MAEFCMPALGADMEAGMLVMWRRKPGELLQRGDVIAEVETDKGVIEVEVWSSGVLERYLVEPGQKVPVGTPLAILSDAVPSSPAPAAQPRAAEPAVAASLVTNDQPKEPVAALPLTPKMPVAASPAVRRRARELGVDVVEVAARMQRVSMADVVAARAEPREHAAVRSSPAARRRAQELGVVLEVLHGTGPAGAIVLQDVESAAAVRDTASPATLQPAAANRAAERVTPSAGNQSTPPEASSNAAQPTAAARAPADRSALRRAIAAAMSRSKREIPHYYVSTTIDLFRATSWLSAYNAARSVKERILPAALLLKAVARACQTQPELNCIWRGESAQPMQEINVGVAIALRGGGLIAPAIHHADALGLPQLMEKLQDLVLRARAGTLRSSELSDGTITVTSLGEQGVESVLPIIYPPQTAIVGFGRIAERPWVVNGQLAVRPLVTCTLAADHRVTDGHLGARFLNLIDNILQEPEQL